MQVSWRLKINVSISFRFCKNVSNSSKIPARPLCSERNFSYFEPWHQPLFQRRKVFNKEKNLLWTQDKTWNPYENPDYQQKLREHNMEHGSLSRRRMNSRYCTLINRSACLWHFENLFKNTMLIGVN